MTIFTLAEMLSYNSKSIITITFNIHNFFDIWMHKQRHLIIWRTFGHEIELGDQLPIWVPFLLGNDDFVYDNWLSKNWESTCSHKDEGRVVELSFGVGHTLFLVLIVCTFLIGQVDIVVYGNFVWNVRPLICSFIL